MKILHLPLKKEWYEKFRIDDRMKEDLKEKVKQIMDVVKKGE